MEGFDDLQITLFDFDHQHSISSFDAFLPLAILGLQVVHDRKVAHGPRDAVVACEQLLGHDAAEAAAHRR
jgi:hypothetical protein